MADLQPRSDALWILGGMGLLGLAAWLSMRQNSAAGNTLQPTPPAQPAPSLMQATSEPVSTNTLAYDHTALQDPLTSIPSGMFGGDVHAPGMFVETPSGTVIPFTPGIDYMLGSIVHFADGSVQIL